MSPLLLLTSFTGAVQFISCLESLGDIYKAILCRCMKWNAYGIFADPPGTCPTATCYPPCHQLVVLAFVYTGNTSCHLSFRLAAVLNVYLHVRQQFPAARPCTSITHLLANYGALKRYDWTDGVQLPLEAIFFSSAIIQSDSRVHPPSYPMAIKDLSYGIKQERRETENLPPYQ